MTILVTGAAGFIGYHVSEALLARGEAVLGVDNLNDYYDPILKHARLDRLEDRPGFTFRQTDLSDAAAMGALAEVCGEVEAVLHLAAQAGVRYSLENPAAYVDANVMAQVRVLELCQRLPKLRRLVYASSSSVYGRNSKQPFAVDDPVDRPASVYAATKRAAELLAQTYAGLYGLPATGLRFFTVYGPWGRPDMAYYRFTRAIFEERPIRIYGEGRMKRDFTYIDDVVVGVLAAIDRPAAGAAEGHRLYNLGNHRTEPLLRFVEVLEAACGRKAQRELLGMQPGDVRETYADIESATRDLGFRPTTPIDEGLPRFVAWYRDYHGIE
jgi:UDP-glucuronate 4-epimerase